MASKVKTLKERYGVLNTEKQSFLPMYQLVGENVMTRRQDFMVNSLPGDFLTDQLFSDIGPQSAEIMASAIVGNIWPSGARSFRLKPTPNIPDGPEVKKYYTDITRVVTSNMDSPRANLTTAISEFMLDQVGFGICGIQPKKTDDFFLPIKYKTINVKVLLVDENEDGELDTFFIDETLEVRVIVQRYGLENVSAKIADQYRNKQLNEKHRIVWYISPRTNGRLGGANTELPWESFHFEWDTEKILKNSGFSYKPLIASRFAKAAGEKLGRSPSMFAMTSIIRLNQIWEILMLAGEQKGDPAKYLLDNGSLGGRVIDTSPGGLSIFNVSGIGEKAPMGVLFTVGDLQDLYKMAEYLTTQVKNAYKLDQLLDLNNEARQTLGEAQIRDRLRGEGLNSVFTRQITEFLTPLIETSVDIHAQMGLLGVLKGSAQERKLLAAGYPPIYFPSSVAEALKKGQPIYEIEYVSPATRIMRTEEIQGITRALDLMLGIQPVMPEIIDNYDADTIADKIQELTSTSHLRRDKKTKDAIREMRQQQREQQAQVQQAVVGADVGMKTAQAQSMMRGALDGRPKG